MRTLIGLTVAILLGSTSLARAQGDPDDKIDAVRRAALASILSDVKQFAPLKAGHVAVLAELTVDKLPRTDRDLDPYKDDAFNLFNFKPAVAKDLVRKFPLRFKIVEISTKLNEHIARPMSEFIISTEGPPTAHDIAAFIKGQMNPAMEVLELEELYDELKQLGDQRDKETRRWQAHYDFAIARVLSRLVHVYEHINCIAAARSDSLPDAADGEKQVGWFMEATPKVQFNEPVVKAMAKDALKAWDRILENYLGTPWAVIAERERNRPMGLRWLPLVRSTAVK